MAGQQGAVFAGHGKQGAVPSDIVEGRQGTGIPDGPVAVTCGAGQNRTPGADGDDLSVSRCGRMELVPQGQFTAADHLHVPARLENVCFGQQTKRISVIILNKFRNRTGLAHSWVPAPVAPANDAAVIQKGQAVVFSQCYRRHIAGTHDIDG